MSKALRERILSICRGPFSEYGQRVNRVVMRRRRMLMVARKADVSNMIADANKDKWCTFS